MLISYLRVDRSYTNSVGSKNYLTRRRVIVVPNNTLV